MIKDQCDNCNKQETLNCSLNIAFNGQSCDMYSKTINLDRRKRPVRFASFLVMMELTIRMSVSY